MSGSCTSYCSGRSSIDCCSVGRSTAGLAPDSSMPSLTASRRRRPDHEPKRRARAVGARRRVDNVCADHSAIRGGERTWSTEHSVETSAGLERIWLCAAVAEDERTSVIPEWDRVLPAYLSCELRCASPRRRRHRVTPMTISAVTATAAKITTCAIPARDRAAARSALLSESRSFDVPTEGHTPAGSGHCCGAESEQELGDCGRQLIAVACQCIAGAAGQEPPGCVRDEALRGRLDQEHPGAEADWSRNLVAN
jgi:hypothetical protein